MLAPQVLSMIGVRYIGVIFYGALDGALAHAFTLSLAALLLLVAVLTRLLPERKAP